MSTAISPVSVTGPDGTVHELSTGDNSKIKGYPGQSEDCPVCGANAADAPEGQYGITYRCDKHHKVGDNVWEFAHCFKCGYRGGNTVVDVTKEFEAFKQWRAQQMQTDLDHPSVSADNQSADQQRLVADLQEELATLRGKPSFSPSATTQTKGEAVGTDK